MNNSKCVTITSLNELSNIYKCNLMMFNDLKKITKLIDTIGYNINQQSEYYLKELEHMKKRIDDNSNLFVKICNNII